MLLRCINAEHKKLKYSLIWLAFLFIPIFPAVIGTANYLGNIAILKSQWFSLWTQHTLFYANFFHGPLIAIYCSYLWRLEHLNGNWNMIMTSPVPRSYIFLGKFITVFRMSVMTQIWVGILFFICGKLIGLPGSMPLDMILWLLLGCIGSTAVISLQLFLSMIIRSFSVPVILALIGSIAGVFIKSAGYGLFWAYSIMSMGMNTNGSSDMSGSDILSFVVAVIVLTVIFTLVAVRVLKSRDVKR